MKRRKRVGEMAVAAATEIGTSARVRKGKKKWWEMAEGKRNTSWSVGIEQEKGKQRCTTEPPRSLA